MAEAVPPLTDSEVREFLRRSLVLLKGFAGEGICLVGMEEPETTVMDFSDRLKLEDWTDGIFAEALAVPESSLPDSLSAIESLLAEIDNAPGIWGGLSGRAKRLVHQAVAILEAHHAQSLAAVHNAALEKAADAMAETNREQPATDAQIAEMQAFFNTKNPERVWLDTALVRRYFARIDEAAGVIATLQREYSQLKTKSGQAVRAAREGAWLIEWPISDNLPARWWHPGSGWMIDANKATRFARKEDAESYIKQGRFTGGIIATEHVFLLDAPQAEQGDAKCPTCNGTKQILHMWERPGGAPGNGYGPCPTCQAPATHEKIDAATTPIKLEPGWLADDVARASKRMKELFPDDAPSTQPQAERAVIEPFGKMSAANQDCLNKAHPDEPMFILLARDPNMPKLVMEWAERRLDDINSGALPNTEAERQHAMSAIKLSGAASSWHIEHPGASRSYAWKSQP